MSADNYLYVRKRSDGKWSVTMEFASSEGARPLRPTDRTYPNWKEAYLAAQEWEREEPYPIEYGIHSDPAE